MVPIKSSLIRSQCKSVSWALPFYPLGSCLVEKVTLPASTRKLTYLILTCRPAVTPRLKRQTNRGPWRLCYGGRTNRATFLLDTVLTLGLELELLSIMSRT